MRTLSAADANRHFSSVLREVAKGETITVVSRGKPVATIAPVGPLDDRRLPAKALLLDRLKSLAPTGSRNWTREELYDV